MRTNRQCMMSIIAGLFVLCLSLLPAAAAESEDKFRVDGETLYYDTLNLPNDDESDVEVDDIDVLLKILREHEQIRILDLNSGGGDIWAGEEMGRMVRDFELDTVVAGECSSSCVSIFLAGKNRRMMRGGKIGFHGRSWSPESVERYYTRNRKDERWETAFEFGSWIYEDTQEEIFEELSYMLERGVDPGFAIKTIKPRAFIWFPSRAELLGAGVISN